MEATLEMPTVDQLVKIFEDRKWKVTCGVEGARRAHEGECCAIPAVIAHYKPDFDFDKNNQEIDAWIATYGKSGHDPSNQCPGLYKEIRDIGIDPRPLWMGFDKFYHDDEVLTNPWYILGRDLRKRLDSHA